MAHCDDCRSQLLDLVYGLLDAPAQEELQTHLADCPACQQELLRAQRQQTLFARAARPLVNVPVFARPQSDASVVRPAPAPTVTFRARAAFRVGWAAAAAAIILVISGLFYYEGGKRTRTTELAAAQAQLEAIDVRLAKLEPRFQQREQEAVAAAEQGALHLEVLGPAQIQPGARGALEVRTQNLRGEPAGAAVHVKLMKAKGGAVLHEQTVNAKGEARVEIPSVAESGASVVLVVEAKSGPAQAKVEETLRAPTPTLTAHLATSKTTYRPGDPLLFRVLALDRFSLQPPAAPVKLHVELLGSTGAVLASTEGPTDASGTFAGALSIAGDLIAGNYRLRARPVDAAVHLEPQVVALDVARDANAVPEFDKGQYSPGDAVAVYLNNRQTPNLRAQVRVNNQEVPSNLSQVPYGQVPFGNGGFAGNSSIAGTNLNSAKKGDSEQMRGLLKFKVPHGVRGENAQLDITLEDGRKKESIQQVIPLVPTRLGVDFFPEGGDLVAGVPNRVFFRVRVASGEPTEFEGKLIVLEGNRTIEAECRQGLGSFEFTPDANASYTARLTSAAGATDIPQPFAQLGIKRDGLVLHVADGVARQGAPVQVALHNRGQARKVLLVAECRGQVVDQRAVEVGDAPARVQLQPAGTARGVLRITAYQANGESWQPAAERLAYRAPTGRLKLAMAPLNNTAGAEARFNLAAHDENDKATPAWLLATVVDERYRSPEMPLAQHFYLTSELGRAVEDWPALVDGGPAAWPVLDLFLGTHGWRRFVPVEQPQLARVDAKRTAAPELAQASVALPALFSRENASLTELRRGVQARLHKTLATLRDETTAEAQTIGAERAALLERVGRLRLDLQSFEELPRSYARAGLAVVFGVLLLVGAGLLLMGMGRLVRGYTATSAFASAFACLAVCAGVSIAALSLGSLEAPQMEGRTQLAAAAPTTDFQIRTKGMDAVPEGRAELPHGDFAELAAAGMPERQSSKAERQDEAEKSMKDGLRRPIGAVGRRDQVALARSRAGADGAARAAADRMLQRRVLEQAEQQNQAHQGATSAVPRLMPAPGATQQEAKAAVPAAVPIAPAPAAVEAGGGAYGPAGRNSNDLDSWRGNGRDMQEGGMRRDYAYRRASGRPSDTLLWQPSLFLAGGSAQVSFETPAAPNTYRVLLLGHDANGRLGYFEELLPLPATR